MGSEKCVFISGSNRGIGKASLIYFAKNGWDIVAHARSASSDFQQFIEELSRDNNVIITPIYFDMTDADDMKAQIKEVISKQKLTIHALVNNVGICDVKLFLMTSVAQVRDIFEVNFFSHLRLTQLILKRMKEGGAIVNVASMDGLSPERGETAYASSKAAMIAWTKVLSKELEGTVRVNAVAPFAVNTDMAKQVEDVAAWKGQKILEPCDVAKVIYSLASGETEEPSGSIVEIKL